VGIWIQRRLNSSASGFREFAAEETRLNFRSRMNRDNISTPFFPRESPSDSPLVGGGVHRNRPIVGLYSRRLSYGVAANSLCGEGTFPSLRKRRSRNTVAPVVRKTNIISRLRTRAPDGNAFYAVCAPFLMHLSLHIYRFGTKYPSALYTSTVHFCKVCDQN